MGTKAGAASDTEHGIIVIQAGDDGSPVANAQAHEAFPHIGVKHRHSGDTNRLGTGNVHQRCQGMGNIVGSRQEITPVLGIGTQLLDLLFIARIQRVVIFALGKQHFTQCATLIDTAHLLIEDHVGIVFRQHIDSVALLGCPHQRHTFSHSAVGGAFTEDMDIPLQCLDSKGCVVMEEVAQEHSFHTRVIQELVKVLVHRQIIAKDLLCLLQLFLLQVTNRHDLTIVEQNVLIKGTSSAQAKNAHFYGSHIVTSMIFVSIVGYAK